MSFAIHLRAPDLVVWLGGVDRLCCGRAEVRVALTDVSIARIADRRDLERRLDHRVSGYGPHAGRQRRRVGTFMGRDVGGRRQFWAVRAATTAVVVAELDDHRFARLVLDADLVDPEVLDALGIAEADHRP
jgi:hypothetical protein